MIVKWYSVISAVAVIPALAVAWIAWTRRAVPGGKWLTMLMIAAAVWSGGAAIEYASVDIAAKVTWAKLYYIGVVSCPLLFFLLTLEYTRAQRLLTRRYIALYAAIPILSWVLALTNDWHGLIWTNFTALPQDANLWVFGHGAWFWIGVIGYSYLLVFVAAALLIHAAIQSSRIYRWQALTLLIGAVIPWAGNILYSVYLSPLYGLELTPLLLVASGALLYWALNRLHLLELVPVALRVVVESMSDAMLVLDGHDHVIYLNTAALRLFDGAGAIGRPAAQVLHKWPVALDILGNALEGDADIQLTDSATQRDYSMRVSPIHDARRGGVVTGRVVMLRDQTVLMQAQDALQRAAVLEERERMARELHDSLGQVLSFLSLNAYAVRDLIEQGSFTAALGQLDALSLAAQSASVDVREHILNIKTTAETENGFTDVLKRYLARFESITGLRIQLSLPEQNIDDALSETAYLHLLRIIQEALANARKHAHASLVQVLFTLTPDSLNVVISDDGAGFDIQMVAPGFGLDIMRDRAAQLGAQLEMRSAQGQGTQVLLQAPRILPDAARAQLAGVTVLIADDHALVVEGLRNLLEARGLVVVGVASDGDEAVQLADELKPDMVLLDVHMPVRTGPQAVRLIKSATPETQVVMLSASADNAALVESMSEGASGFLIKSQPPADLFLALVAVRRGDTVLAPGLVNQLATQLAESALEHEEAPSRPLRAAELSRQQVDILARVALGQVYKTIASDLGISESAVKYHMDRIQRLLKVSTRSEAIAQAYKTGVVPERRDKPRN